MNRLLDNGQVDIPFNNKVGTKRYMAPELLNETIDEAMFDNWKMADVYSLGLVYWELARRCSYRGDGSDIIAVKSFAFLEYFFQGGGGLPDALP